MSPFLGFDNLLNYLHGIFKVYSVGTDMRSTCGESMAVARVGNGERTKRGIRTCNEKLSGLKGLMAIKF